MKIVTAWVQVTIEIDEDEVPLNQKLGSFIEDRVNDGGAEVSGAPVNATIHCGCGEEHDSLDEACEGCVPERQEWAEDDARERGRSF